MLPNSVVIWHAPSSYISRTLTAVPRPITDFGGTRKSDYVYTLCPKKHPPFFGKSKKSLFNTIIHSYFRLFTLSQKKTNCYFLTYYTWKISPHYFVKTAQILQLFHFFSRVSSTNSLYGRVAERKRLVATWAEFQQSMVDDTVDQCQKRLEACIRAVGGHFEHLR